MGSQLDKMETNEFLTVKNNVIAADPLLRKLKSPLVLLDSQQLDDSFLVRCQAANFLDNVSDELHPLSQSLHSRTSGYTTRMVRQPLVYSYPFSPSWASFFWKPAYSMALFQTNAHLIVDSHLPAV